MESTGNQRKRLFLKAELAVLVVCLASFWAFKSGAVDIDDVKAGVLKQVVKIDPDSIGAHRFLADYYDDSDRYQEARRAYKETVRIDPNDLDAQSFTASLGRREGATAHRTSLELQEHQQLNDLDMALEDVNEYVAQQRQKVENWYAQNLANLQKWAKSTLEQLDAEEKAAWARCLQNMNNITSIRSGAGIVSGSGSANTWLMTDDYAATNGYFNSNGSFSESTHSFVVGDPAGQYNLERQSIRNSRELIEAEFVKLQQEKQRYMAEIESLADRRRGTIHAAKRAVKRDTRLKLQGGPGMIDAISTGGRPLVMIEGEIFYEGDVVRGFKIRKISNHQVEFEKNGQIWVR